MVRELGIEGNIDQIDIPIDFKTGNVFPDDPTKAAEFEAINPNKRSSDLRTPRFLFRMILWLGCLYS